MTGTLIGGDHPKNLAAALLGAGAISFSAILVRLASVSPVTAAVFRSAYALPLLGMGWLMLRRRDHRSRRARAIAFGSGLALAADLLAWHASIDSIGAGLATLLANVQVVVVTLAAWALFGERPTRRSLAALPVVLAGVALVTGLGQSGSFGDRPVLGAVLGVAAALFYGLFLLAYRRSNRILAPAIGPLLDATAGALVGSVVAGLALPALAFDPRPSWPSHGWLLLLAVGTQVVGWLLIGYALPRLPARETSFLILLQPILTITWGAMLFAERVSAIQAGGVILVLAGIGAVVTERSRLPAPAETLGSRAG